MDAGQLVPDEVVIGLVEERLRRAGLRARASSSTASRAPCRRPRRSTRCSPDAAAALDAVRRRSTVPARRAGRAGSPGGASAATAARCSTSTLDPPARDGPLRPLRRRALPARRRPRGARSPRGWTCYARETAPLDGLLPRGRACCATVAGTGHAATRSSARIEGEPRMILLKSREEIERMRRASGDRRRDPRRGARRACGPGVTTAELDALAEELTRKQRRDARPSRATSVGGRTFPASICISINDEVVHGIPSARRVLRDGRHRRARLRRRATRATSATRRRTVPVGQVSPEARAADGRDRGGARGRASRRSGRARTSPTSRAPSRTSPRRAGYSLVREFVGHGIGRKPARGPAGAELPDRGAGRAAAGGAGAGHRADGERGAARGRTCKDDGWTAATRDGRLSAHFEHSVAVTADGPYILSLP